MVGSQCSEPGTWGQDCREYCVLWLNARMMMMMTVMMIVYAVCICSGVLMEHKLGT